MKSVLNLPKREKCEDMVGTFEGGKQKNVSFPILSHVFGARWEDTNSVEGKEKKGE